MNHSSTDSRQALLPAGQQSGAITAIHAVMVPVFAAWASAF